MLEARVLLSAAPVPAPEAALAHPEQEALISVASHSGLPSVPREYEPEKAIDLFAGMESSPIKGSVAADDPVADAAPPLLTVEAGMGSSPRVHESPTGNGHISEGVIAAAPQAPQSVREPVEPREAVSSDVRHVSLASELVDSLRAANGPPPTLQLSAQSTPVTWAVDTDGFWDEATNWSTGSVPGANDDVVISRPGRTPVVTIRQGASAKSLIANGQLVITNGSSLTLNGDSTISEGISLNGSLVAAQGTVTLDGTSTWTGGAMVGSIANLGTLTISGGVDHIIGNGATVTNSGIIVETGGRVSLVNGTINNQKGGVYEFQADNNDVIFVGGGGGAFNNEGVVRKSAGAGSSLLHVQFNNRAGGAVESSSGTLAFGGGGTFDGATFATSDKGVIELAQSVTMTYAGLFTGSGSGTVLLSQGTIQAGETGATFQFAPGVFQWSGGSLAGTITNVGTITLSGGGDRTIGNPGTLINQGRVIQLGGRVSLVNGVIDNRTGAVYEIRTVNDSVIFVGGGSGLFTNAGTISKTDGEGLSYLRIPVNNNAGIISSDKAVLAFAGGGTFHDGTFQVGASGVVELARGTTLTYVGLFTGTGAGTVQLNDGTLSAADGGANFAFPTGMFRWSGGALAGAFTNSGEITIVGGDHVIGNPGSLTNLGTILQKGGRISLVNGTINNTEKGRFEIQTTNDNVVFAGGGSGVFNNAGLIYKSADNGISTLRVALDNSAGGILRAESGTLAFTAGTWSGGTFELRNNAVIDLARGGGLSLSGNYTGSGQGIVELNPNGSLAAGKTGMTFDFPTGLFQWNGGTITGTLTNLGMLTVATSNDHVLGNPAVLNNEGVILQTGGRVNLVNGTINNQSSGVYEIQTNNDNVLFVGGGGGEFNNSGTVRKSAGGELSTVRVSFNNAATAVIEVTVGSLALTSGVSQGGTFSVAEGAILELARGGTSTLAGTYSGSGAGTVQLNPNGALRMGGDGTTFNFPGSFFQWNGGAIEGTLTNLGTLNISTGNDHVLGNPAVIENQGTIVQSGGRLNFVNGTINNSGVYDIQTSNDNVLLVGGGGGVFNNSGTLRKTGGDGLSNLRVPINSGSSASIDVYTGAMALGAGGSLQGSTFSAATGTVLELARGVTTTISGNLTGSGNGSIQLNSGGSLRVGQDGVTLNFPGQLFQWNGGSMEGTVTNAGTITIATGNDHVIGNPGTLDNRGTVLHTGGRVNLVNGTIRNAPGATYELRTDNDNAFFVGGGGGLISNAGDFVKSGGTGTARLRVAVDNTGAMVSESGQLILDGSVAQVSQATLTGGSWKALGGATLSIPSAGNLTTNQGTVVVVGNGSAFPQFNGLKDNQGSFTVEAASFKTAGDVSNSGNLILGPAGTLEVTGNFVQAAQGTLGVQISGSPSSGQSGKLLVDGEASLNGTLAIQLTHGYGPTAGQSYTAGTFVS